MAGSTESYRMSGLNNEEKLYFALKTTDAKSNSSLISNVVYGISWDTIAPATVTDVNLTLTNNELGEDLLRVSFAPSGDDWLEGEVSGYELYVHTGLIRTVTSKTRLIILASNDTSRFIEGLPLKRNTMLLYELMTIIPTTVAFLPMFQPTRRVFLLGPLPTLPLSVSVFQK